MPGHREVFIRWPYDDRIATLLYLHYLTIRKIVSTCSGTVFKVTMTQTFDRNLRFFDIGKAGTVRSSLITRVTTYKVWIVSQGPYVFTHIGYTILLHCTHDIRQQTRLKTLLKYSRKTKLIQIKSIGGLTRRDLAAILDNDIGYAPISVIYAPCEMMYDNIRIIADDRENRDYLQTGSYDTTWNLNISYRSDHRIVWYRLDRHNYWRRFNIVNRMFCNQLVIPGALGTAYMQIYLFVFSGGSLDKIVDPKLIVPISDYCPCLSWQKVKQFFSGGKQRRNTVGFMKCVVLSLI